MTARNRSQAMRTAPSKRTLATVGWILVSSCLPSSCMAKLEKLRQHDSKLSKTRGVKTKNTRSLSSLWENEALLAQSEADRVLFHWEHVFESLPTPRPTPKTKPPTPSRAPAARVPTTEPVPTASPVATIPPTPFNCLVGTTLEEYLLEELSKITPESLLTNPSTPQGKAYLFMVNDPLQPDVCTYPTLNQRYAMATIYYSTNGAGWADDTGWLSALNECTWLGITCDGGTEVTRLELGKRVLSIDRIWGNCLLSRISYTH